MNAFASRIRRAAQLATLAAAVSSHGCGANEESTQSESSIASSRERDVLQAAVAAAAEVDPREALSALPPPTRRSRADSSAKIHNGTNIGQSTRAAMGTVLLDVNGFGCTAQVINRHFLLSAAHCMAGIDGGNIAVFGADANGIERLIYNGPAIGSPQPSASGPDRDVGLVWLQNGMDTCEWDSGWCAAHQPGAPVNSMFRYFIPGHALPNQPTYQLYGWGPSAQGDDWRLRTASMAPLSWWGPHFNPQNDGASMRLSWTAGNQARPCQGDSGSPIDAGAADAPFYMGILSQGNVQCTAGSGTVSYTLMTESQLGWMYFVMENVRIAYGLPYHCVAGGMGNDVFAFSCDNTGSVY